MQRDKGRKREHYVVFAVTAEARKIQKSHTLLECGHSGVLRAEWGQASLFDQWVNRCTCSLLKLAVFGPSRTISTVDGFVVSLLEPHRLPVFPVPFPYGFIPNGEAAQEVRSKAKEVRNTI